MRSIATLLALMIMGACATAPVREPVVEKGAHIHIESQDFTAEKVAIMSPECWDENISQNERNLRLDDDWICDRADI